MLVREDLKKYEYLKIYERNPDTKVIRWRYMFEERSEARVL